MIAPMKKLLMAAKAGDKEKVINLIRNTELVHVEPVDVSTINLPAGLSQDIDGCKRAISIIEGITADQNLIASPGTPSRIIKEILEHTLQIPELNTKLSELRKILDTLTPWGDLNLADIALLEENNVNIYFLKASEICLNELDKLSNFTYKVINNKDRTSLYIIAASTKDFAAPEGVKILEKPSQSWTDVSEEKKDIKSKIAAKQKSLAELALRKEDLKKFLSELINKKRFSEVETSVLTDENVFVLQGWCPASETEKLTNTFEEAGLNVGIQFEDPTEGEKPPPTHLSNSAWVSPIQHLYDFMGMVPSYNEPDTSALFLSTLILFTSFIIADAGYGLIVLIALLLAYKPLTNKGVDKGVLHLMLLLFGGTSVYGIITNTYFGETALRINSFDPNGTNGTIFLQGICFLIGVSHLTVAHLMKIKNKKTDIKLLSDIGWIIFLWAMYAVICNLIIGEDFIVPLTWAIPMFKVSILSILLFTAPSSNIPSMLGKGLGAILQNASAAFADIVSYIRLWAVGLAGGKVAAAFNDIGGMLPHVALSIPVWIIGHGANIVLGAIAILAHGVRLNLLEFTNHLELDWAGHKYDPFKEIK